MHSFSWTLLYSKYLALCWSLFMLMKVIIKHSCGYCWPPHSWYRWFDHGVPTLDSGVHLTIKSLLQLSHLLELKTYIIKNRTKATFFRILNTMLLPLYHTVPCRWGLAVCCETLDVGQEAGVCVKLIPATQPSALIVLLQLVALSLFCYGAAWSSWPEGVQTVHVGVIIMLLTEGGHVMSKISQYQSSHCFFLLIFKLLSTPAWMIP